MAFNKTYPLWVSYSKIEAFSECPRKYYLRHLYKDSQTGNKITIIKPALALGQAVHQVLENLSKISSENRRSYSLLEEFEKIWQKFKGKKGGFTTLDEEEDYKQKGLSMLKRILINPGPLFNKSIRTSSLSKIVKLSDSLSNCWLSEEEQIILSGKIDWLEHLPEDNSIHIIDFKTGQSEEKNGSLQLPVYLLLAKKCQARDVKKMSYWYLQLHDTLTPLEMPDQTTILEQVLEPALKIKEATQNRQFSCIKGGCYGCEPYELIVKGEAEFVGIANTDGFLQDTYILN